MSSRAVAPRSGTCGLTPRLLPVWAIRGQNPDFLARPQRLHAGIDNALAGFEPLRDHDGRRVVPQDVDLAQGHGEALRIDDPDGRTTVRLGHGARRYLDANRR